MADPGRDCAEHSLIIDCNADLLWRGDLSPLGCVAALKPAYPFCRADCLQLFGAASRPNGDKSPRHKS
ncbi:Hypothetical protein PSEBR_m1707 [Pseudomonas brassicacearum subsp. brassicacearum NFM421]|uniref:Uncharacterized protein n=1 Tax=Pseudomonas brassicacearum (strain NFM421) TaxID=994484 RepID=F2K6P3_PSEBN|nr:Hypothetical protein PSEBR_m1707 [Pseudomonas brassicacearum subsp. brassicacearum NFM421]